MDYFFLSRVKKGLVLKANSQLSGVKPSIITNNSGWYRYLPEVKYSQSVEVGRRRGG